MRRWGVTLAIVLLLAGCVAGRATPNLASGPEGSRYARDAADGWVKPTPAAYLQLHLNKTARAETYSVFYGIGGEKIVEANGVLSELRWRARDDQVCEERLGASGEICADGTSALMRDATVRVYDPAGALLVEFVVLDGDPFELAATARRERRAGW
jgi:hypothetical protein